MKDDWVKWLGKKYVFGDDPLTDEGCDCFSLMIRVRQLFDMPAPTEQERREILELARDNKRKDILKRIKGRVFKADGIELGSFSFLFSPDHICVYTCVGEGILQVHTEKGVSWSNTSFADRRLRWYHWH